MHKVALSPHVISVWIKMDYWITRASTERERETAPDKKYGWLKLADKCIFFIFRHRLRCFKVINCSTGGV